MQKGQKERPEHIVQSVRVFIEMFVIVPPLRCRRPAGWDFQR